MQRHQLACKLAVKNMRAQPATIIVVCYEGERAFNCTVRAHRWRWLNHRHKPTQQETLTWTVHAHPRTRTTRLEETATIAPKHRTTATQQQTRTRRQDGCADHKLTRALFEAPPSRTTSAPCYNWTSWCSSAVCVRWCAGAVLCAH